MADTNTPAPRPPTPKAWRRLMRVTGALALLLFLAPTVYVVKYYAFDRPRETQRAALVSTARILPAAPLDTIAPPLAPPAPGNAAEFYARAIQSYADRTHAGRGGGADLPTPSEMSALFEGARRPAGRFFPAGTQADPHLVFRDPDGDGAPLPYHYPVTAREKYRYLSAAVGLARATAHAAASASPTLGHQLVIGRALVRFGDALGREGATRTHLAVAHIVKRLGLGLLLRFGGNDLKKYVYSQQTFDDAVQAKYTLLEPNTPDNLLLQAKVAQRDADPLWRREAVWALGETLSAPDITLRRPLEALTGKATLAAVATRDPNPSVRAAASATLGQIAQRGAVIQR